MIDRPTWGDGSGRSSGVAVTDDGAGDNVVSLPARADKREPRAPVVRPDWSQSDNLSPVAGNEPSEDLANGPDKTTAPPRGEDGRFIPAEMAQLRETWDKEGGYEFNLKAAQTAATAILSRIPDPADLSAHFDTLPVGVQAKIMDVLRLQPSKRTTANASLLLIEDSLSPAELATLRTSASQLMPEHREAILDVLGGAR
jgi:hypothetical protein